MSQVKLLRLMRNSSIDELFDNGTLKLMDEKEEAAAIQRWTQTMFATVISDDQIGFYDRMGILPIPEVFRCDPKEINNEQHAMACIYQLYPDNVPLTRFLVYLHAFRWWSPYRKLVVINATIPGSTDARMTAIKVDLADCEYAGIALDFDPFSD